MNIMDRWIIINPALSILISLLIGVLLASFVLKIYVDYRVKKELIEIRQQLDSIEQSTNLIVDIIKESRNERSN